MKIKLSAVLFLIASIILTGCGSEEAGKAEKQESTETTKTAEMKELSPTEEEQEKEKGSGTLVDVNAEKDFKYMQVGVGRMLLKPDVIEVELTYENLTDETVSWFPNQGQLVVDNIQLETDVLASDQISGEVRPGVKSSGIIAFKPPRGQSLDVPSVKTVNFYLGTIYPEDLTKSKTKEIEFAVYIK